ncbi:MAG: DUF1499 domain-containing protein [Comamonadaceae bacterium]|nr:DUF1499 domain-containing protein [Comamonadaceae bacterium]
MNVNTSTPTPNMNLENTTPSIRLPLTGLLLGLVSLGTVLVAGIGYRQGWWPFLKGLQIAEWAVYAAALGVVISLVGMARLRRQRRAVVTGLLGVLLALPVLGMALQWEYATRAYPPINDISTDTVDPPEFWDMPNPMAYPGEAVAQQQRAGYPDLAPLTLPQPPAEVFEKALQLVQARGWSVVASDAEEGRIEAVATTRLFGFADEVSIRIAQDGSGSRVDMRSRSRLGKIDRGTNARRIRDWLADLKNASKHR